MAQSIRVTKKSDQIAEEIHAMTGMSKTAIIEAALEEYYHQEKMRLLSESFKKYRSDKRAWEEELQERKELDGTLEDGIFENQ